jgi:hypothetical protein
MDSNDKAASVAGFMPKVPRNRRTNRARAVDAGQAFLQQRALQIAEHAYSLAMDPRKPKIAALVSILNKVLPNQRDVNAMGASKYVLQPLTSLDSAQAELSRLAASILDGTVDIERAKAAQAVIVSWIAAFRSSFIEDGVEALTQGKPLPAPPTPHTAKIARIK